LLKELLFVLLFLFGKFKRTIFVTAFVQNAERHC